MSDHELLFHYTNGVGLQGIVNARAIWVSDVEFLNDAQELQFGRHQLHHALIGQADAIAPVRNIGNAEWSRASVMRVAAAHFSSDDSLAKSGYFSVYAACFCESPDLLSQWRGYAAGNGFALGFERKALAKLQIEDGQGTLVELAQIKYGDPAIPPMIESVLASVAPQPAGHPSVLGYHRAATVVLPALAKVKHQAFVEEQEWRLIATSDVLTELSFRIGPGWIVPLYTCAFPVEALRKVALGPGPNQLLRERGLRKLLAAHEFEHTEVASSRAPFRSCMYSSGRAT